MSADPELDMAMLDATEKQVMESWESFTVEFERIHMPGRHEGSWKVSYRTQAKTGGDKKGGYMAMGGGATLRQAMQAAFLDRVSTRLDR